MVQARCQVVEHTSPPISHVHEIQGWWFLNNPHAHTLTRSDEVGYLVWFERVACSDCARVQPYRMQRYTTRGHAPAEQGQQHSFQDGTNTHKHLPGARQYGDMMGRHIRLTADDGRKGAAPE